MSRTFTPSAVRCSNCEISAFFNKFQRCGNCSEYTCNLCIVRCCHCLSCICLTCENECHSMIKKEKIRYCVNIPGYGRRITDDLELYKKFNPSKIHFYYYKCIDCDNSYSSTSEAPSSLFT